MSKPANSGSQNDVSRLLKQLRMDSFEFRTFDRGNVSDEVDVDIDLPVAPAEPPAAVYPPPPDVKAVPPSALKTTAASKGGPTRQEVLDAAFGRLVRQAPLRAGRQLSLKLNLALHPSVAGLQEPRADEPIGEVFSRLLCSSRQRDDGSSKKN